MNPMAIVFMIIGLCITWGGMFAAISIQIRESKKGK